jgi:hypothetical protein
MPISVIMIMMIMTAGDLAPRACWPAVSASVKLASGQGKAYSMIID